MSPRKSRSLKVAHQHIERVKNALSHNGFLSQQAFAEDIDFSPDTVRKFFNGIGIDRSYFTDICTRLGLNWREIADKPTEIEIDPDFVGREAAMITLNELSRGAKVILIQGAGGVGKTTLARKYLTDKFDDKVIEFPIAKETENIAPVEGLLEQYLRSLGEEPGRDFLVSLARLKHKLQAQPMGVLIDNLEPALDQSGRLIEPHRRYLELLRVLADPMVKSVTLITSRESLGEGVDISLYRLPSLALEAWQAYFKGHKVEDQDLSLLWDAYHGNALAMKLLLNRIELEYNRDVATFQKEFLPLGTLLTIENLIKDQFDRLAKIHPDAYHLLCRMGCYRYQDVPTVPKEGLFCLLWDVEEEEWGRVIKDLRNRSLIDYINGEFQLHPLIQKQAVYRLKRNTQDWKQANRKAADFWTKRVKFVETVEDAFSALESYYHYMNIEDYKQAIAVIIKERYSQKIGIENLGGSFNRLGFYNIYLELFNEIKEKPPIKEIVKEESNLKYLNSEDIIFYNSVAFIYSTVALVYRLAGKSFNAIKAYENAKRIADKTGSKILGDFYQNSIGLVYMDLGDYNKALEYLTFASQINDDTGFELNISDQELAPHIKERSLFCLAYIYSCLDNAKEAKINLTKIENIESIDNLRGWGKFHKYLFLALTFKNLGEIDKAFKLNKKAIELSKDNQYTLIEAKALID